MHRTGFIFALAASLALAIPIWAHAQTTGETDSASSAVTGRVLKGVVWEVPESAVMAMSDLRAMKAAGIEAIRTGMLVDSNIMTEADSLGLVFYRELPFTDTSIRVLTDSLAMATRLLSELLVSGQNHSSAGPIGLAVGVDVSRADACSFFDTLRSGVTNSEQAFYYVGRFVESDTCGGSVDFVILDAAGEVRPQNLVTRWQSEKTTAVGIIIGKRVDEDSPPGLQEPNSQESQARFYESTLTTLLESDGLRVVFSHRWRDQPGDQYGRLFGLHAVHDGNDNNTDSRRLSLDVLGGIYTGSQAVFALRRDNTLVSPETWFTILGWILLLIVAALYTSSPRFRDMTPRYFLAHGFYRNAVREAREVLPIVSTALLTVVGLATGMIATKVLLAIHEAPAFEYLVRLSPEAMQSLVTVLINNPMVATFFLGSISLLGMTLWMGFWMIVAGQHPPLLPSQALMLAVWPRWQLLVLLPVAMAIATLAPAASQTGFLLLYPIWAGVSIWAGVRTAYDIFKLTNCSPLIAATGLMLHPAVLTTMGLIVVLIAQGDHVLHVLHLVFRS